MPQKGNTHTITITHLLRAVVSNCDVECIGRAKKHFITLVRKESWKLQRWKAINVVSKRKYINRHEAPKPQSWVAPTMKNEVQTCHPHPSIRLTSKVSWCDPRWNSDCANSAEMKWKKQIVLPVLSFAKCYNECRYVQSASRLHITANLECLVSLLSGDSKNAHHSLPCN